MPIADPINVEELARSLQEPLLPQEVPEQVDGNEGSDRSVAGCYDQDGENETPLYDGLPLKDSVLIKSLYFLDALGSSTWGRFSAIYYNSHGLNTQQIGVIEGLRTLTPTISNVFWGIVADRFRCRKQVWVWTKSGGTAILLLLALPNVSGSFYRILWVSVGAQLFVSNGAILDAYTLELLGTGNKLFYGRYRLYASLSWGLGSIAMGWITDHYGFDWNFIMFGVLSSLMIGLVAGLIPDSINSVADDDSNNRVDDNRMNEDTDTTDDSESETDSENQTSGRIIDLFFILFDIRVQLFLVEVIVMGAAMATVERLLFLYMVNDLDASTLLCGLSVGVNVLFELPIFWFASPILQHLGPDGMFLLSMTCFVVRVYGYTILTPSTKWWILALESMHGVTFATFWIVTTDVSKALIDKSHGGFWSTTIPSIVQMLYNSVGATIGSVVGGYAMHRFGSRPMYLFTAKVVLFLFVIHSIGAVAARTIFGLGSILPGYHHNIETENNGNSNGDSNGEVSIEQEDYFGGETSSEPLLDETYQRYPHEDRIEHEVPR